MTAPAILGTIIPKPLSILLDLDLSISSPITSVSAAARTTLEEIRTTRTKRPLRDYGNWLRSVLLSAIAPLSVGHFFLEWGVLVSLVFVVSYGKTQGQETNVLPALNGASVVGRVLSGYLGDLCGCFNITIISIFLCAAVLLTLWPPGLSHGFCSAVWSLGALSGMSIAGAVLERYGWPALILFSAFSMFLACAFFVVSRSKAIYWLEVGGGLARVSVSGVSKQ